MELFLITAILLLGTAPTLGRKDGLIAYDCADNSVNITTFSLTDITPCIYETMNVTTIETRIQVVQSRKHVSHPVKQCSVIFERDIQHCGMHSHSSLHESSYRYIVKEFNHQECDKLHETRSLNVHEHTYIHLIPMNTTTRGKIVIVGSLDGSTCQGGNYFDGNRHFKDVVVQYQYEVFISSYEAQLNLQDGQILLRNNLVCKFDQGSCLDAITGYTTWTTKIDTECTTGKYSVLYEGLANKTYSQTRNLPNPTTIYSAISQDKIFSIKVKSKYNICGYPGYSTDHNDFYILEPNTYSPIIKSSDVHRKDLDLFTYFNSKITLVEHHVGNQLTTLYQDTMHELCKLDKSLLETRLILARINPQEFASSIMQKSGYTAVIAGEVIHIIECKPVYVTLAVTDSCYQEIRVTHGSDIMFLSPVTRILQRHGTEIECNPYLPAKFNFKGAWYQMNSQVVEVKPPNIINSEMRPNWTYVHLPDLMERGIYDKSSVAQMHEMLYEHDDRRSAEVVIYRTVAGLPVSHQDFKLHQLVATDYIESTIDKYWKRVISFSTMIGQITSSVVGFWLIGKFMKFIIDSLVHCRILYDIYGLSWKLVASFWDSMTTLLTHRHHSQMGQMIEEEKLEKLEIESPDNITSNGVIERESSQNTTHVYPLLSQPEVTIQISNTSDRDNIEFRPRN